MVFFGTDEAILDRMDSGMESTGSCASGICIVTQLFDSAVLGELGGLRAEMIRLTKLRGETRACG